MSSDGALLTGKAFHDKLLPTGEKLRNMIKQLKTDCFLAVQMYHPNTVGYFGMCYIRSSLQVPVLLQEFVPDNLTSFLERTKKTLTFARKLKLSLEMASGLKYLHSRLIVATQKSSSFKYFD